MPADLPVAAPDPAAIRERAEYAVSDEFADMLLDAPEDAPRWAAWLGADALALLAERQQAGEALRLREAALASLDQILFGSSRIRSRDELEMRAQELVAERQQDKERIEELTPAARLLIRLDAEWFDPFPLNQGEISAAVDRARAALAVEEDAP